MKTACVILIDALEQDSLAALKTALLNLSNSAGLQGERWEFGLGSIKLNGEAVKLQVWQGRTVPCASPHRSRTTAERDLLACTQMLFKPQAIGLHDRSLLDWHMQVSKLTSPAAADLPAFTTSKLSKTSDILALQRAWP